MSVGHFEQTVLSTLLPTFPFPRIVQMKKFSLCMSWHVYVGGTYVTERMGGQRQASWPISLQEFSCLYSY